MGKYTVAHLGHNINKKKDKDPVIKIEFTPSEGDYQKLVSDLTALKSLKIIIESDPADDVDIE